MRIPKFGLRAIVLIIAGVTGGYICDVRMEYDIPIFSILLPIMALAIAIYISKETNQKTPD